MGTAAAATAAQVAEPLRQRGVSLLIEGPPGSGKSTALLERFLFLTGQGVPAEQIAVLAPSAARATHLRHRLEARLPGGFGELLVLAPHELAGVVLARTTQRHDLSDAVLTAGERLALLAQRMDELVLTHHDFGGNASALLAGIVMRIDALKAHRISAARYAAWAEGLDDDASLRNAARARRLPPDGAREREFAALYQAHDRMLSEAGMLDRGDLLLLAARALSQPARPGPLVEALLVDDAGELSPAVLHLLRGLAAPDGVELGLAVNPDGPRFPDAPVAIPDPDGPLDPAEAADPLARLHALLGPTAQRVRLDGHRRTPTRRFWRAASERAQAQAVAAEIERLIHADDGRPAVDPGAVAVLVPSVTREGPALAVALEERAIPHRLVSEAAFFARPEIRDLLAWLRVLADPADAPAAVRALARPPVELRSVDIARVTQIARRRKLDMVAALAAATESPQVPPEGRERIRAFLRLYRAAVAQIDTARPDLYVLRLIERLELRRRNLFIAQPEVVEQLRALARFGELASAHAARAPQASARDFARFIAAVADQSALSVASPQEPSLERTGEVQILALDAAGGLALEHVFVLGAGPGLAQGRDGAEDEAAVARRLEDALSRAANGAVLSHVTGPAGGAGPSAHPAAETLRAAAGADWEEVEEELYAPGETLAELYRLLREELLSSTTRTAGRLAELRLDTDLDISHAVVRYLELLKVAALMARPEGQPLTDALFDVNARLAGAVTAEQREILASTPLDELLFESERDARRRAQLLAAREEPSLARFLPLRGEGVLLSASDIDTYRACPLKYKFARVFRLPQEPTLHQRFGIAIHQVLERYHHAAESTGSLGSATELLGLLDSAWRRQGFGDSDEERQLRRKAERALGRYCDAAAGENSEPVWFERSFSFRIGPHLVRGRVDRVDRLPSGEYELIDYKTGRPRPAEALAEDVQLSLYTVAAREAWGLETSRGAYLYLLDDAKAAISGDAEREAWIRALAHEVAEGIRAQEFEPTPSVSACGFCDYRLACPAAER